MTEHTTTAVHVLMPVAVFLAAGLSYSLLGYWAKLKSYLRGDPAARLDYRKIGRSAVLGLVLGAAAYFAESSISGDVGDLTTPHEFAQQVVMTQGAIYAIDRLVLSGRGGTQSSAAEAAAAEPAAADDTTPPDLTGQPPGKTGGTA